MTVELLEVLFLPSFLFCIISDNATSGYVFINRTAGVLGNPVMNNNRKCKFDTKRRPT